MPAKPAFGEIVGHYRLLERVGQGGMGIVYRAHDEHLQREVAIKLLPDTVTHDESARRRFRQEALTLARLNHSNIETLYGFETDGKTDFLVMEYIHGATLASKLTRGPLPEPDLLGYAIQLASALEEAHKQGVIHRDLKPSNILITPDGQLKMLDFGLARLLRTDDQSTTATDQANITGTLHYIPPECLSESHAVDARSDLYSCGVVLYEMATARPPYAGDSVASLFKAILEHDPAPVRSLNPAISPELERIIFKTMDKDPGLRYQSARELKVDLQRMLSARRIERLDFPIQKSHSAPTRWMIAGSLLLLTLLTGVTVRWAVRRLYPGVSGPRVVAVLPFEAVGGVTESQVLCRGLTDLLTTRLTQVSKQYGVEVIPAGEVRTQGVNSITDARQKLGVTLVVEGSWDFADNQVMYSLVDARSRRNVNAEFVKANIDDLLSVEQKVADSLLKMVAGELKPNDQNPKLVEASAHPDAYQYYVRGVGYLDEYQNVSSLTAAIALFQSAVGRDPTFAAAFARLGEAYWRLFQENKDSTLISQALDACHRATALNDQLASVHNTLGLIAQGQGKYDEAANEFQRAIALDDTGDAAYRGLATSYEAVGKNADAEAAYQRAIQIRKDYWGGYSALGALYYKTGRYADAAAQFRRVIELAPDNVRGYSNLSAAYVQQGKTADAEELLRKSLAIQPSYRAYANLATIYFFETRYSESARMFEKALQLNDHDGRVWRNLADAYYWSVTERAKAPSAYQHGAELLTAQLKINPEDPTLLVELALCQSMLGKSAEAVQLMSRARQRSASDPEVLFRSAEIYEQSGDHTAALEWLAQAVRKGCPASEIEHDPTFQKIREDARYKHVLQIAAAQPPH